MEYEPVIGLEVHAQLLTQSKIFCPCSTAFGAPPNTNTCPVCLGLPGSLPVLNEQALEKALKASIALNCEVRLTSIFARKNYFYPDLPKGYQISMYELPLAHSGKVSVYCGERSEAGNIVNRRKKTFRIHRIHMEEDAGKLIHDGRHDGNSFVDLNRSGVPLIEIVSEPDLRSSQEAYDYLAHLRKTLMYIEVCDGNMEEGSLRCDANISVRTKGTQEFGTKIEIKNLNSLRFVQKALDHEIERQIRVLESGGTLTQETRLWDEDANRTTMMRSKEEAHDYRYFPEPDLIPVTVLPAVLKRVKSTLPELPEERRSRLRDEYRISEEESILLTSSRSLADYFEEAAKLCGNARAVGNWVTGDIAYELKNSGKQISGFEISPRSLADMIKLIDDGTISGKMAKTIFSEMHATGESPASIISRLGLVQISGEDQISAIIEQVLNNNPDKMSQYRAGREKLFGYFFGEVMKRSKGQANPQKVNDLLRKALSG